MPSRHAAEATLHGISAGRSGYFTKDFHDSLAQSARVDVPIEWFRAGLWQIGDTGIASNDRIFIPLLAREADCATANRMPAHKKAGDQKPKHPGKPNSEFPENMQSPTT